MFAKLTNDTKEGKTVQIPAGTGFMQGFLLSMELLQMMM